MTARRPRALRFETTWTVDATPEELLAIFVDTAGLTRWWADTFLRVREVRGGDDHGVGRRIDLHTKGALPYTIRSMAEVVHCDRNGLAVQVRGDFEGLWAVTLREEAGRVVLRFDWPVTIRDGTLRALSWVPAFVFAWNHRWAMARGREGVEGELARRRTLAAAA